MKISGILYALAAVVLCAGIEASEYFSGYDVNQPQVRKPSTQRALDYDQAYNAHLKARATGLYDRFKSALGFRAATQLRPRVSEYEKAYMPTTIASQTTAHPRGYDLSKAYEDEARKDYKYAQQAYKAAEAAKERMYAAKDKAYEVKNKAWSKRNRAYGDPKHYAERDHEYQGAVKAHEDRSADYSKAHNDYWQVQDKYLDDKSNYRAIKSANKPVNTQDFNALLQEAEARSAVGLYPWYKKISRSGNY